MSIQLGSILVISVSTPAPQASAGPKTVILDLGQRRQSAAPEVNTVRGKSVSLPSGEQSQLPAGQFGSITECGSGLAWLTRSGGKFRLSVT